MSENIFVWEVGICKSTFTEPFEKIYFIAANFFQLSHLVALYVYGDDENDPMYDFQVEISSMTKVQNIGKIVNADFDLNGENEEEDFDLESPLDVSRSSGDDIIEFKCTCEKKVRVDGSFQWPATKCPHCSRIILRRDLSEIKGTGIWAFVPSNGAGK